MKQSKKSIKSNDFIETKEEHSVKLRTGSGVFNLKAEKHNNGSKLTISDQKYSKTDSKPGHVEIKGEDIIIFKDSLEELIDGIHSK